ncbi:MAG: prepilin-type N-terminal cleavage/methylation domain-containing protein [Phycisphaerales bacterium]
MNSEGTKAQRHQGTADGTSAPPSAPPRPRRAFSLVELLIALTVSATLLTATMVALDVMFKRYSAISDSAGSHVVARTVMHRMLSMIRTGSDFGPFPADVLDTDQNPVTSTSMEFVSAQDTAAGTRTLARIERREATTLTLENVSTVQRGPFALWLVIETTTPAGTTIQERPLIDGVTAVSFNLLYDVGPRLLRATIDLSIQPRSSQVGEYDATTRQYSERRMMQADVSDQVVRLVASAGPRMNDGE